MEIGISTAAFFRRAATEDALPLIASQGAAICEVFLESFSEYTPSFASVLQTRAADSGLRVISVHPMSPQFEPQLFSLSVRQREDSWALFENVLRTGRTLGARYYVMHGPATMRGALKNAEVERIGPIIADLAHMASSYGIRLAWENVSWCLFDSPSFPSSIEPYVKDCDLGYTFDVKQAARSGFDPFDILHAMGDRLCHVHVCDYVLHNGKITTAMPGQGSFDFRRLGQELRAMNYQGSVMLEPYSDLYGDVNELGTCLSWLKDTL